MDNLATLAQRYVVKEIVTVLEDAGFRSGKCGTQADSRDAPGRFNDHDDELWYQPEPDLDDEIPF